MVWLYASVAFVQAAPTSAPNEPFANEPGGLIQRLSSRQKAADQLTSAFDAGDSYLTAAGQRRLFRLAGSLAVRFEPRAEWPDSLAGYTPDTESVNGLVVFQAPRFELHRQLRDSGLLAAVLTTLRQQAGVLSANPVFIEPESGLARIATGEIIVCLRPNTDPQSYFKDKWSTVKRLRSTRDSYLLNRQGVNAEDLLAEVNRLAADPQVAWAEPNFLSQVLKQSSDPLFPLQWALNNTGLNGAVTNADVNAPEAWMYSAGSDGIVLAILDDGAQINHPDLGANIFSNPGEALNGLDDDANGYVDDAHGWDFFNNDNDPSPEYSTDNHGTAAAGLAAAAGNNSAGGVGMAYRCRIMPLKVMGGGGWAPDSVMAEAIYYAAGRTRDGSNTWRGADIISISLSFPQSAAVDGALQWAAANGRSGKGCPIFAAAGDEASRWKPARVRLPVGAVAGPGTFRFAFEYSKDGDDQFGAGEDLVKIDNVVLLGEDGVTQLDSSLGANGRQDFEGAFPPVGWQLKRSTFSSAGANWIVSTDGPFTGTRGSRSARSGAVGNNQWAELRTPAVTLTGAEVFAFSCYISSETDPSTGEAYDGLKIWVYDAEGHDTGIVFEGSGGAPLIGGSINVNHTIGYPASNPNVIAVGASTDCDVRADYSAYGPGLDFLAPSSGGWNEMITTDRTGTNGYAPGDYTADFGGTSAACSLAAGIGALALSVKPELTAAEVRTILRGSCDKIGDVTYDDSGWNQYYGYGRANAQRAVETAAGPFRVAIIGPADNSTLLAPTNVIIAASATDLKGTIRKVEFFVGATKIGEATNAPYVFTWKNPPHGRHTLIARATDNRGSNIYSAAITVTVVPALAIGDATVVEGNVGTTNAVFTVRLLVRSTQTVSVAYSVIDGTAVAGRDYVPVNGLVVFPPGVTNQTVRVAVIGNRLDESNKTFFVTLANATNAGIARGQGRATIIDNDPLPSLAVNDVTVTEGDAGTTDAVFTVRLSVPSGNTVSVQYSTANNSALANVDYMPATGIVIFPPGVTNRTVAVAVIGDTLSESNTTFFLNLSNAVNATILDRQGLCTIVDDDPYPSISISDSTVVEGNRGLTNALFTVNLSARSGKAITVNYATANGTALAGRDFVATNGIVRFPPGTISQTIRVGVIGDTLSESNETFLVNLTRAVNATIEGGQGVGTILDDDAMPALTISNATVTEGNAGITNAVFTVRLSAASGRPITVDYATADDTALAGSDYLPTNGTVKFLPGTISQSVRVAVLGDKRNESNETFFVNLDNAVNASIADGKGLGTILNDDPLPALFINDVTVTERNDGPTNAVFTVRLSAPSGKTVTVNYATTNGTAKSPSDYETNAGQLVFLPGETNRTVVVTVFADAVTETNETFAVNLTAPVNATIGDGRGVCTIRDSVPQLIAAHLVSGTSGHDLRITETRIVGTNVLISFTTMPGQACRVEYTDRLLGAETNWISVPEAANIEGTGSIVTVTNLGGADQPVRFYRIRLLP